MAYTRQESLGSGPNDSGLFFRQMSGIIFPFLFFFIVLPILAFTLPLIVSVSALVMVTSFWWMHHLVGAFNFRRVNISTFYYWMYVAVIITPGFFIYHDEISPGKWRFLFGIESALLTVPLGIWITNFIYRFSKRETDRYFLRDVENEDFGRAALKPFLILLVASVVLVLVNLIEIPEIPLLYLIRNPGDFLNAALVREDSFKLLNSNFTYAYYVVRGTIFPFLAVLAYGRYRSGGGRNWKRLFWISLTGAVFYASLTIEKLPVAAIFAFLGLFYYLFKGGRMSRLVTIVGPILFVSFPLLVIMLSYGDTKDAGIGPALAGLGARIFYSPSQVLFYYFEIFPNIISFQHGAAMMKLAHLMGWSTIDIPNTVGLYMAPPGTAVQSVSANGCFLGNLNADFGLPAVVIGGVAAGFLMQLVHVYLTRKPKTNANLTAYAACMWAFSSLVSSPLTTVLLSGGVTFALILAWLLGTKSPVGSPSQEAIAETG